MDGQLSLPRSIHSFIHSFIHPFIHSFIHSFIHPFIHAFIHPSIHSFIHSFISIHGTQRCPIQSRLQSVLGGVLPQSNAITQQKFVGFFFSGGIMLGGLLVRRFNLKKSCKLSAKYCLIFQILASWTATAFIIPGCDEINLAGVVKPYHNRFLNLVLKGHCHGNFAIF